MIKEEAKRKNVPEVRFEGFEGEWERKKLGEIARITMGQSPLGINYTQNPQDHILVQGNADMKNGFVTPRVWTKQVTKTANAGDLIMSVRAPVGEIGKTEYDIVIGRGVAALEGNEFIFQNLKRFKENDFWKQFSAGSTFDSINSDELLNIEIAVTSPSEQSQIGTLFQQLDNQISHHRTKLQKLQQIKQAMLTKMFPQDGAKVPEVRFEGFEGDWEEKKLGEIGEIVTGSTPTTTNNSFYSENGTPWVTPTDINNNITYNTAKRLSKEGEKVSRMVPAYTILVTSIASIGKNTLLGCKGSFNQQINGLIPNFDKYDAYFLYSNSYHWSNKMKKSAGAGTMQIVNKTEFSQISTLLPSLPEQSQIGSFFQQLDTLLAHHQKQLDKLGQIKNALLDKLFV